MVLVPAVFTLLMLLDSIFHPHPAPFRAERVEFKVGYALGNNNNSQSTGFQYAPAALSAVVPMTDWQGSGWWKGRVDWNPELLTGTFTYPNVRPLVGLTPLQFRYQFAPRGHWWPYFQSGFGGVYSRINNRVETGKDLNFNLMIGAGIAYALNEGTSLMLEYRHHHFSNGDTDEYNSGIDANAVLAGVSLRR